VFQRAELEAFVLGECAEDVAAAIVDALHRPRFDALSVHLIPSY